MAEFQEVMKQYNRMFEAHKKGVSIPVEASYETAVKQPEYFEEVVMSWAAEHPEPVYPTWFEVLEKFGVAGRINGEPYYNSMDREIYLKQPAFTPKAFESIPADIAQKLDIQPKEV